MYTHVNKCKNDKIKREKKKIKPLLDWLLPFNVIWEDWLVLKDTDIKNKYRSLCQKGSF
jgi:hypothetical protein